MSVLPSGSLLVVDDEKLTRYLLNTTHPVGRHKARFFLGHGFSLECPDALRLALIEHGKTQRCSGPEKTAFGEKYVVDGLLRSPSGRRALIRTVWFIETGGNEARLVTAYPVEKEA